MPRERLKPAKLPPNPTFERVWPPDERGVIAPPDRSVTPKPTKPTKPTPDPPRRYVKGATGPVERLTPAKPRKGRK